MLLRGGEVFDGVEAIGHRDVEFGDGLIAGVRPPSRESPASGLALLPGLIDTHVHLVGDAAHSAQDFSTWPLVTTPEEQVLHGLGHAQRALRSGVTTVREMTAGPTEMAIARAVEEGIVTGCRVVTHGMVSMTAGHYDLFTPPAVRDRRPTADGPDACRAIVRTFARSGVDGVKIATSGGVLSIGDRNSWRNHTNAELDAIVDEAHALGMLVAAHAHTADGVQRALTHGVDSLEHATLIDERSAQLAAERGVTIAPTLLINDVLAEGVIRAAPGVREKALQLVRDRDCALQMASRTGVDFVLGTDANGYHVRFGDQLREIALMARVLGLTAGQALTSATSLAARAVGRPDTLGRLREGYAADAVLVRGRPWSYLGVLTTQNVVAVVPRGTVVYGAVPDLLS